MSISDLMSNEEKLSRVGKKWLPEEDVILLKEMTDKKTFEEISLEHKRTITGIKSRVITQILYPQYKNDNISLDELSSEYNIEKELVEKYINKIETNSAIKKSVEQNTSDSKQASCETKPKTNRKLLFEKIISLETKMLTIEQKLDFIISIISK
jgi:hypothetical protein